METCTAEIPEVFVLSMWALETVSYFFMWHLGKLLKPVFLPVSSNAVEILLVGYVPNEASGKPATYLPDLVHFARKMKDEQSHSYLKNLDLVLIQLFLCWSMKEKHQDEGNWKGAISFSTEDFFLILP